MFPLNQSFFDRIGDSGIDHNGPPICAVADLKLRYFRPVPKLRKNDELANWLLDCHGSISDVCARHDQFDTKGIKEFQEVQVLRRRVGETG